MEATPGGDALADAPSGRDSRRIRFELRAAWHRFAPAVGLYTFVKATGFVTFFALVQYARDHGQVSRSSREPVLRFFDVLGSWDGVWYAMVAAHGYHPALVPTATGVQQNSAAFFPLYPALIRIVHTCTGLGYPGSALLASILASLVAAAGIYAVAHTLIGHKAALICVALWAVFPSSGVEWSGYSESTLIAVASWCLYFTLRRRWLLGGLFALLSGLGRPTAFAVVAAYGVAAIVELVRRRDGRVRPLVGLLMAPAGVLGFLLWVGLRMGRLDGYSVLERKGWGQYIDFGAWTAKGYLRTAMGQPFWHDSPQEDLIAILLLTALPMLIILLIRMRPPVAVLVYVVLFVAAGLCSHQNFGNVSRYLLPAFPLLLPVAAGLRRLSWPVLLSCLVIAGFASGWYAGYIPFVLGVP
ncbi:glycosyltransferase family 39 protein [Actinospica durhamensis]|uniref:Glycosyltransferase family 39 protein n=1 Tax=Actinospica durhamensis TaxID=1508375 RepID=A0A941IT62_9ACTN|nr:glycosyltransferase family 39 protein [Actinospica durhamensis]MBR7837237.1 glycosyltransferase family 39 protein [Actinospica durhamensis]